MQTIKKKVSTNWSKYGKASKQEARMNKKSAFKKWIAYISIVLVCTAIGGDFGLIASIALTFMLQ